MAPPQPPAVDGLSPTLTNELRTLFAGLAAYSAVEAAFRLRALGEIANLDTETLMDLVSRLTV